MRQIELFKRINLIINLARRGGFTWDFLSQKMKSYLEIEGVKGSYQIRTFQRDLDAIRELYGIDIQYNRGLKKYLIDQNFSSPTRMHLLESLDLIHAFELVTDLDRVILFDTRKPRGTQHLSSLISAIRREVKVSFKHYKNWVESEQYRLISPLALKEVNNYWYLIGLNETGLLRNYGLNRIHDLKVMEEKFKKNEDLDLNEYYNNVFGILNDSNVSVDLIKLHFSVIRGHYIKSMPIHHSQKIIQDDQNGLIISLELKINPELVSEILSHGDQVKVLEPDRLKKELKRIAKTILHENI